MFSLKERKLGNLVLSDYLKGGCSHVGVVTFSEVASDRMRPSVVNLPQRRFMLDIRENVLIIRFS